MTCFATYSVRKLFSAAILFGAGCFFLSANEPFEYHIGVDAQTSSKSTAPYMLGSWNRGRFTEGRGIWQEGGIFKELNMQRRFSWSAGAEYIVGYTSDFHFDRYENETKAWTLSPIHTGRARIAQLFATLKYRTVFLNLGLKDTHSPIVDEELSSGDLVRSNNAANIPGIGAGFLHFVDIPFTKGWVQIDGEIMYGRMTDFKFKESEFNYYSNVLAVNLWHTYKRCYFRTKADQPFRFTVGMQTAGLFGGSSAFYNKGTQVRYDHRGFRFADIFRMFFPTEGGENYYAGSHLGSWDLKAEYAFRSGARLIAYAQWPWEDGSGIGRQNGWDGVWGLEFVFPRTGVVDRVLVEYLDFTNQSGPIHYSPTDHPDSPVQGHAVGGDDYYNNVDYGGYTNYGISIGTPFLKAPLYYSYGNLDYLNNRSRGFHAAVAGSPSARWHYRVMVSYQAAGGNGRVPAPHRLHNTSAMVEAKVLPFKDLTNLEVGLRFAFDKGSLFGNNVGARLSVTYRGSFTFNRSRK